VQLLFGGMMVNGMYIDCRGCTCYSGQIQMKHEFFRQIFEKSFQWDPSCSVRTDGRTDRHEVNSRFSKFTDAFKMGLKEMGWKDLDWCDLVQDRCKRHDLVGTAMQLRVR
jgi:pyruvate-formate lyase-activating enzyme